MTGNVGIDVTFQLLPESLENPTLISLNEANASRDPVWFCTKSTSKALNKGCLSGLCQPAEPIVHVVPLLTEVYKPPPFYMSSR